ncbi:hypothetical protein OIV36_32300, partial [Burkholderia pseudomallei]|uniref:hypothetical protein n=1 Tax=Burkholderia pseudomallei TaxID=28450 RepID=UPI0021F6DF9B
VKKWLIHRVLMHLAVRNLKMLGMLNEGCLADLGVMKKVIKINALNGFCVACRTLERTKSKTNEKANVCGKR